MRRLFKSCLFAMLAIAWLGPTSASGQVAVPSGIQRQSLASASAAVARPSSEGRSSKLPIVVGALAGAGVGLIALFAQSDCRRIESMCGLAIPLYVGGGALLGGAVGYVWSRR